MPFYVLALFFYSQKWRELCERFFSCDGSFVSGAAWVGCRLHPAVSRPARSRWGVGQYVQDYPHASYLAVIVYFPTASIWGSSAVLGRRRAQENDVPALLVVFSLARGASESFCPPCNFLFSLFSCLISLCRRRRRRSRQTHEAPYQAYSRQ